MVTATKNLELFGSRRVDEFVRILSIYLPHDSLKES